MCKCFYLGILGRSQSGNHPKECRKSDNRPKEHLAKSGYKLPKKYKSLIILLYLWLHNENQVYEYGDFYFFFSLTSGD
jgi:hypothetical protein